MLCVKCGNEIEENFSFCPNCGMKIVLGIKEDGSEQENIINETEKKIVIANTFGLGSGEMDLLPDENYKRQEVFPNKKFLKNKNDCSQVSEKKLDKNTIKYSSSQKNAVTDRNGKLLKNPKKINSLQKQEIKGILHKNTQSQTLLVEKISAKTLFQGIFKKHTVEERNEIFKIRTSEDENITLTKVEPWFYSRVFFVLLIIFAIFEICLLGFNNTNMFPAVMVAGSAVVPISVLFLYFELNIYRDISFYKIIVYFLLGGAFSLLITLFFSEILPSKNNFDIIDASKISIAEEIGKALPIIVLIKIHRKNRILDGLLIGGAIGCGFAVFESAGYAFNSYLNAHDFNARADVINSFGA